MYQKTQSTKAKQTLNEKVENHLKQLEIKNHRTMKRRKFNHPFRFLLIVDRLRILRAIGGADGVLC